MIEYNGYVTIIEDFLQEGSPDSENPYSHAQTFQHWMTKHVKDNLKEEEPIPQDNSSEEEPQEQNQFGQLQQKFDRMIKARNEYFEEQNERNEEYDSYSSEDPIDNIPMMSNYEKEQLAKWDNMIECLNSIKKEN